jgi:SAM-dependent methyltransferase
MFSVFKLIYKKLLSEKCRIGIHVLTRKSKSYFLAGDDFYCACCNKSFKNFLTKGNGINSRKNALCSYCGSFERTRLLFYYLKNETTIFANQPIILHVAPEDCLKQYFVTNPNYYDVDINPNFASAQMDITNATFKDGMFDYIICSHVLGHIKNEKKAIRELRRVLKSDGVLLILSNLNLASDSTYENANVITLHDKLLHYGENDLERLHGNDLVHRLQNEYLSVTKIDYRAHFSESEQLRYSLGDGKRELIFRCTKVTMPS